MTSEFVIDAPPHIWGMHDRAARKQHRAHRAWRRSWTSVSINGKRWLCSRSGRHHRRGSHWDRRCGYWQDALQVLGPYIVRKKP